MPTEIDAEAQPSRTERFAAYVREAALSAGYDIDSPRGGGRTQLAKDTGMSASSVGRMLAGQTLPDPLQLESLAEALRVPFIELLVRSGVVSPKATFARAMEQDLATRSVPNPSPAEAARMWGIRSPDRIAILESLVHTLVQQEREEEERGRSRKAE